MDKKEEDFEKAMQEMLEALKDLPPDVIEKINQNYNKMKKNNKIIK